MRAFDTATGHAYHLCMTGERNKDKSVSKPSAVGRAIGLASELGIAMGLLSAAMLLGCLALGRWLDRVLDSAPVLTIILLLAGVLASQLTLYRMATSAASQLNQGSRHALDRVGLRRTVGLAARVLLFAVMPALAGAVLGLLLDRLLGTAILLTALLTMLGFGVGIVLLLRLTRSHAFQGDS